MRSLRHGVLRGIWRARWVRGVSDWRWRVRRYHGLRRKGYLLRCRRVLEAARLRGRAYRSRLAHARGRGCVVVLSRRILDVALLRIRDVLRSRISSWRLLRISRALFRRQICVSAHGDGFATRGPSSHVSVSDVYVLYLLLLVWSRERCKIMLGESSLVWLCRLPKLIIVLRG